MNLPLDHIEAIVKSNKSKLYYFLAENHDFLRPLLQIPRPNYLELASYLGEQGLTDSLGNPPTKRTLQRTWKQVKSMMDERRKTARSKVSPAVHVVSQSPQPGVATGMDAIRAMLEGRR